MEKTGREVSGPDAVQLRATVDQNTKALPESAPFAVRPWGEVIEATEYNARGLDILVGE